ncbi:MAG TPA: hypothetical protein VM659_28835 [Dongiaceae bacterium]|nr:hypothetical protein [Dongiaceae bacterium]
MTTEGVCDHCGGKGYINSTACRAPIRIPCSACGKQPAVQQAALAQSGAENNSYDVLLENYREAWQALHLIREAVEQYGVGIIQNAEYLDGPTPMHEAEAIVKGIAALCVQQPVAAVDEPCGQYPGCCCTCGYVDRHPDQKEGMAHALRHQPQPDEAPNGRLIEFATFLLDYWNLPARLNTLSEPGRATAAFLAAEAGEDQS